MRYLTRVTGTNLPMISGLESETQILLNLFSRWCSWADIIVRVDKYHSFGIKKFGTSSKQFQSKIFVNKELIPPLMQDEYFTYLGRHFDYKMTNNQHKDDLLSDTKNIMKKIDDLPLHPKNKMLIYQRYVLSKLSWNLTLLGLSSLLIIQLINT